MSRQRPNGEYTTQDFWNSAGARNNLGSVVWWIIN